MSLLQITQHIRFGLMPLPFGTLLPMVATSYMLETLGEMQQKEIISGSNRAIRTLSKVDFKEKYSNKKINSCK